MDGMTRPPLDELRALAEKATPGPWRQDEDTYGIIAPDEMYRWIGIAIVHHNSRRDEGRYNQDLIIAAVNALPSLLSYIAELERDAERLNWLNAHPRKATVRIGGDIKPCVFYGVSCDPKHSMRAAIDAARGAGGGT